MSIANTYQSYIDFADWIFCTLTFLFEIFSSDRSLLEIAFSIAFICLRFFDLFIAAAFFIFLFQKFEEEKKHVHHRNTQFSFLKEKKKKESIFLMPQQ